MRTTRILLIPTTVAWFLGALWWIGSNATQTHAGRSGTAPAVQAASIIHLGPVSATESTSDPTTEKDAEPSFERLLVIPFVKNKGELALDEAGENWCTAVREHLVSHPEAFIVVTGHTDADGDPALNMQLSIQRAEIVKEQLIKRGLPGDRITAEGMGSYEPIADNTTSKGKAMNRRVEIRVQP